LAASAGSSPQNCRAARRSGNDKLADLGMAMQLGLIAFSVAAVSVTAEYVVTLWLIIFMSQNLREIAAGVAAEPAQAAQARTAARNGIPVRAPARPPLVAVPARSTPPRVARGPIYGRK
jgi:hypothetical protein